jgi:hypothetical protein
LMIDSALVKRALVCHRRTWDASQRGAASARGHAATARDKLSAQMTAVQRRIEISSVG